MKNNILDDGSLESNSESNIESIDKNELIPYLIGDSAVAAANVPLKKIERRPYFSRIKGDKYFNLYGNSLQWKYQWRYVSKISSSYCKNSGLKVEDSVVIYIERKDKKHADLIVKNNPKSFDYFLPIEERFFRSLPQRELIRALGSKQAIGASLVLAKKILAEQGFHFSNRKIIAIKVKAILIQKLKNLIKPLIKPLKAITKFLISITKFLIFILFNIFIVAFTVFFSSLVFNLNIYLLFKLLLIIPVYIFLLLLVIYFNSEMLR